jgi:hypothetical protein
VLPEDEMKLTLLTPSMPEPAKPTTNAEPATKGLFD